VDLKQNSERSYFPVLASWFVFSVRFGVRASLFDVQCSSRNAEPRTPHLEREHGTSKFEVEPNMNTNPGTENLEE